MSDLPTRLLILGLIAGVTVLAVILLRAQARRRPRIVSSPAYQPGVYLFSSSTCLDCAEARGNLDRVLGRDGYTEVAWETSPSAFEKLAIGEVPALMIVDGAGQAHIYRGTPEKALRALNP